MCYSELLLYLTPVPSLFSSIFECDIIIIFFSLNGWVGVVFWGIILAIFFTGHGLLAATGISLIVDVFLLGPSCCKDTRLCVFFFSEV